MSDHDDGVPFLRVSGAGNDFLALAEPDAEPAAEEVRSWCRRGVSLGADGLFVLRRRPAGGTAGRMVVDMAYFNADGGAADLCLNGARCAAQVAFHLGWADGEVEVSTGAGPVAARQVDAAAVAVELPRPEGGEEVELAVGGQTVRGRYLVVGVPHLVVEWPAGLGGAPLGELGPPLRRHPRFPHGANVSFVHFPSADRLEIRTWERGVEAETLACGTGVMAAIAVGVAQGRLALPVTVLTAGGFAMTVAQSPGSADLWTLAGDARVLAEGRLLPAAADLPAPPRWARP
jgi:diaminopimelate epimerase